MTREDGAADHDAVWNEAIVVANRLVRGVVVSGVGEGCRGRDRSDGSYRRRREDAALDDPSTLGRAPVGLHLASHVSLLI